MIPVPEMNSQKQQILDVGKTLGLKMLHFSSVKLDNQYDHGFRQWIEKGYHAEMDYLARRLQENDIIDNRLPGARTVIVTALNYYRPDTAAIISNQRSGLISRYAVIRDYHKVFGQKLKKMASFMETELQGQARYYVDTGPLMEKAYAESCGMGVIGKNSLLITPQYGSWVFLGVIVTDLELEAESQTLSLRCGSCRRCMTACPTNAIVSEGVIDSSRCFSYLTIEHKGPIPIQLREAMGEMIFGCDICQEVCPHNSRAKMCSERDFKKERFTGRRYPLEKILHIQTDREFTLLFQGTPMMRAKRRGLQRNACIAAGNSGDSSLVPVLEKFSASTSDEMLKEHAGWAIQRLK